MDLAQCNLLDDFRISGSWWLPSKPGDRVSGTLSYNRDSGIRLELTGVFNSPEFSSQGAFLSLPQSVRLELVLGGDADGQVFTLHKVDLLNLSSTSAFRVSYLLVGKHFSSTEEIIFSSALMQYTHLEAWSCYQFTRLGKASPNFSALEVPINIVTLFKTTKAGLARDVSLDAYTQQHFTQGLVEFRPRAHFSVTFDEEADLRTAFAFGEDLGQLMTMLIGEPSYVKKLRLLDRNDTPIEVFYPSTIRAERDLHPLEMCFSLRDIASMAPALVSRWFDSLSLLEPVFDLVFGTLFARGSFVRTKFLNLMQGLETFHRRASGGTYTSPDDFERLQTVLNAAIPAGTPEPLRRRLSDSLKYANEYSLRKRIRELLQALAPATIQMLKISDVAGLAAILVKTRNYLTHFDEESRTKLVDDIVAMHYMNERLTALLFTLILKRLGLPEDTAVKGTLKRRFFQ